MFAWRHELSTTDPAYYKWTQWLFLQLYKAGKAYRKKGAVNWCPECKTVLANEQVINGFCERHPDTRVEQRDLEQWFFRITDYAERLLDNLDDRTKMDWSDTTTQAQRNWMGRSEGAEIDFAVDGDCGAIRVYTTRPDTLFGATFMVLAPEHPLVAQLTTRRRAARPSRRTGPAWRRSTWCHRKVGDKDKTGVFTGAYAINPATGEKIPVWIADYVLMEYGTGAIMAVPAHDERDFAFARKFGLPVTRVLAPRRGRTPTAPMAEAETDTDGYALVQLRAVDRAAGARSPPGHHRVARARGPRQGRRSASGSTTGASRASATGVRRSRSSTASLRAGAGARNRTSRSCCRRSTTSGPTTPACRRWRGTRSGTTCPARPAAQRARRETDVSDTFLDSAWYYLRYPSTEFDDRPFDPARTPKWCPVAMYIGGNEHAVLHLLYSPLHRDGAARPGPRSTSRSRSPPSGPTA